MPKGAGVGPYEPVKFTPSEEIVLQAKANWWGGPCASSSCASFASTARRPPMTALKAGTLDVAFLREPVPIAQAHDDGFGIRQLAKRRRHVVHQQPSQRPGGDLRVRQAIALSIDPAAINHHGYGGKGVPTSALIGPKSVWFSGLPAPPTTRRRRSRPCSKSSRKESTTAPCDCSAPTHHRAETRAHHRNATHTHGFQGQFDIHAHDHCGDERRELRHRVQRNEPERQRPRHRLVPTVHDQGQRRRRSRIRNSTRQSSDSRPPTTMPP